MIMPSDDDYKETKEIMLGNSFMKSEFKPLAEWIDKTYSVKTINIFYDRIERLRPRLEICFEFEYESSKFQDKNSNYDHEKQHSIGLKFKETLQAQGLMKKWSLFNLFMPQGKYNTSNVFVYFSAFEPVAKIEANSSIPQDQILQLKTEINSNDIWQISRCFSGTTFMLYTDEQVKQYENSPARKQWADRYFDLLEPFNEFNYFKRESFNIYLDSKENFDTNYESNWYYYYK